MKKSDLYREYARIVDMCESTNIKPKECVKHGGFTLSRYDKDFNHLPDSYSFAIAIVEGMPVFEGDVLYGPDGIKFTVNSLHCRRYTGYALCSCSWNPPKPKEVTITISREDAEGIAKLLDDNTVHFYWLNNIAKVCKEALK